MARNVTSSACMKLREIRRLSKQKEGKVCISLCHESSFGEIFSVSSEGANLIISVKFEIDKMTSLRQARPALVHTK